MLFSILKRNEEKFLCDLNRHPLFGLQISIWSQFFMGYQVKYVIWIDFFIGTKFSILSEICDVHQNPLYGENSHK